jgi:tetratricopeptide (TPR) repeat protein
MYGYGIEGVVEKNIDMAMEYLSDVSKEFEVDAWYAKGNIYLSEGNIDEAKKWITKASEEGNKPDAMIQHAKLLLSEKDGINKAAEIITRAEQLYPGNLDVKKMYARIMLIMGDIQHKIGIDDDALTTLRRCVEAVDVLKRNNYKLDEIRKIEIDACMDCGEVACGKNEDELALTMLARTDLQKYPYAAVLIVLIHIDSPYKYSKNVNDDIAMINRAIGTNNWRNDVEKATAYYVLSIIYAHGTPNILPANVNYAYECIQKCAEIDYQLAESELKKYTKGFLGKITYKE